MLTREDYRQLAERCALLAGECGAPGVAEALRALALDYLARAASQKQQQTRWLVMHLRGQELAPESALNPILNAQETRERAIGSADQLR
jgi:hypothetical protein